MWSDDSHTPIQDLIASAFMGVLLGFTLYVISRATGVVHFLLHKFNLPGIGGRFGAVQFMILGAVLDVVMDLLSKLTPP